MRVSLKWLLVPMGVVLVPLVGLVSCQGRLIYFPRPYEQGRVDHWDTLERTEILRYDTKDGRQQAYFLGAKGRAERLWLVCGGNGTVALDWSPWLREHLGDGDAAVLMDLPGYGASEGSPSRASIQRSLDGVVPEAVEKLGWTMEEAGGKMRFFGHSLGAAVVLEGADRYGMGKGVLLAPFTSTMDMAEVVTGLPLGGLVWHRFDNRERLKAVTGVKGAEVVIVHGREDEVIPYVMAEDLRRVDPSRISVMEIPEGRHNDLPEVAERELLEAMERVRD